MIYKIKKYPVLFFTILAYICSWIFWIGLIVTEPSGLSETVLMILGGTGPFFSAMIMTGLLRGKKGIIPWLKKIFRVRVRGRWYLLALVIPITIAFLTIGIIVLIGGFSIDISSVAPLWAYPIFFLYIFFLGGGQEEPGWRGFALPRLLKRYSPLVSSLIIGVIWAFWHVPLFFMEGSVQKDIPFVWYVLNTFGFTFIFTSLYLKAASVLPAMVLHSGLNAIGNYVPIEEGIAAAFPYLAMSSLIVALVMILSVIGFDEFVYG